MKTKEKERTVVNIDEVMDKIEKGKHTFYFSEITESLFVHVFIPFIFLIFFLFGAIDAKFVPDSQFQNNYHGNLTMAGGAIGKGFSNAFDQMYTIGYHNSTLWLMLIPIAMIIGVYFSFSGLKSKWNDQKDIQGIIDGLTAKDYEDAERKWDELMEEIKDKEKNPQKYARRKKISTIIVSIVFIIAIVCLGYFRFGRYFK